MWLRLYSRALEAKTCFSLSPYISSKTSQYFQTLKQCSIGHLSRSPDRIKPSNLALHSITRKCGLRSHLFRVINFIRISNYRHFPSIIAVDYARAKVPPPEKNFFLPGLINTTLFLMFSFHLQVRGLRTKTVSSRRTENKPSRTNRTLPLVAREACVSPPCIECVSCW